MATEIQIAAANRELGRESLRFIQPRRSAFASDAAFADAVQYHVLAQRKVGIAVYDKHGITMDIVYRRETAAMDFAYQSRAIQPWHLLHVARDRESYEESLAAYHGRQQALQDEIYRAYGLKRTLLPLPFSTAEVWADLQHPFLPQAKALLADLLRDMELPEGEGRDLTRAIEVYDLETRNAVIDAAREYGVPLAPRFLKETAARRFDYSKSAIIPAYLLNGHPASKAAYEAKVSHAHDEAMISCGLPTRAEEALANSQRLTQKEASRIKAESDRSWRIFSIAAISITAAVSVAAAVYFGKDIVRAGQNLFRNAPAVEPVAPKGSRGIGTGFSRSELA